MIVSYSSVLCASKETQLDGNRLFETWSGSKDDFAPTSNSLQLKAPKGTSASHLSGESTAFVDAEWEWEMRLGFNPSSSNYARLYVASDSHDLTGNLNGYFVQVGNTSDQILLYRQTGTSLKKIAAGEAKRLDHDSLRLTINVKRSADGEWIVASKVNDETKFTEEFSAIDTTHTSCYYIGLYCKYSTTRREAFFFDKVTIKGEAFVDNIAPNIKKFAQSDSCAKVSFTEKIKSGKATFLLDGKEIEGEWNDAKNEVTLRFDPTLTHGKLYLLELVGIKDLAGNLLETNHFDILIDEKMVWNDVIINEILFHPFDEGEDYVELYNRSDKHFNLSNLQIATYKSDSIIYAAKRLPHRIVAPGEYIVVTSNQEAVCQFYDCPDDERFVLLDKLPSYGNEKGNVVLMTNDSILIDELRYHESMHNELQKSKAGVALERISPDRNEWSSASANSGFGTPGRTNSITTSDIEEVTLSNDVCFPYRADDGGIVLTYSLSQPNYVGNVSIFNLGGLCVRHLAKNQLLGSFGEIAWDGKNDNETLQPVAPYILLFEAHNAQGDAIRKKFVCVIGR